MTVCVISQPRFLPGLHYLHRMMVCDVFVILDTVQYTPRHEENRARLKAPDGARWLSVPVCRTHREQPIYDTYIDNEQDWRRKAIATIDNLYGKAPEYGRYRSTIQAILAAPYERLIDLNLATWQPALELLGISCTLTRASSLGVDAKGSELLLQLCREVGAQTYLSGAFGKEYLDPAAFEAAGLTIAYHNYSYPRYPQRHGDFIPFLSYIDLLFNAGLDRDLVLGSGAIEYVDTTAIT